MKEGPWAVHLTLGLDWGVGQYSRYQCRSQTQKSAQVNYQQGLHIRIVATATIDFSLIQAQIPIESEGSLPLGHRYLTVVMLVGVVMIASRAQSFFCAETWHKAN